MMTTVNCRTNRILWQIPRRALLVEAPVLKVPATHPHQHPDLVRFRCSVCCNVSYTCTGIVFMVTVILCASKLNC